MGMKQVFGLTAFLALGPVVAGAADDRGPVHGTTLVDASEKLAPFTRAADQVTEGFGGAAWLDYDGDGDLDLFIVNGIGHANALWRNDRGRFTDVAAAAGVAGNSGTAGATAADIDNDGCVDLFAIGAGGVTSPSSNSQPHKLWINNCDGTFTDISVAAGIEGPHPAMMAAFGDIDNDGYLDLFITNPGSFVSGPGPQTLYRNNGNRTFTDISAAAGIATASGGCVVNFTDHDGDRRLDIIVGSCNVLEHPADAAPIPVPGRWQLWRNNGDLTFTDIADRAGLNVRPGFPMALTSADCDGDGDFDLFATGLGAWFRRDHGLLAEQVLFVNNGDGTYRDATGDAGLLGFEWGWGASFADFDNDGDEDLIAVGSLPDVMFNAIGAPFASPGRLYENNGSCRFTPVQAFALDGIFTSGLAVGDYNTDGFPDAVITTAEFSAVNRNGESFSDDGAPVLLENAGNRNRSITLRLRGTRSNASAVGAVVTARHFYTRQTKQVHAGSGFASADSPWLTFGLGARQGARVEVAWPSGLVEDFLLYSSRAPVTLVEGSGRPCP